MKILLTVLISITMLVSSKIYDRDVVMKYIEKVYRQDHTIDIIAIGDMLIHPSVYKSGKQNDGSYDNSHIFDNTRDFIQSADINIVNQETVLIKDSDDYSGYPCFGSPMSIGDAELEAGFNVICHATNHSYDKRMTGIRDTLGYWSDKDVIVSGMYLSKEGSNAIPIIEKGGIKVAVLNYTYGLNGFKLPEDKPYLVNLLSNETKIKNDLKLANELADFVIVYPHWGVEYTHKPNKEQKRLAQMFADNGADLIIGAHPHVIQPVEIIKSADGRDVPCYYSLGNFISSQDEVPRMLGGVAKISISIFKGDVNIEDYSMIPIVTHYESGKPYTTYFLEDYTEELAKNHRLTKKGKTVSVDGLWSMWNDVYDGR